MTLTSRRTTLTLAFTLAMMAMALVQTSARQAQTRWYDAYQEGVRAVQRRDWASAEKLLLQAQSSGPRPGARVFTYGDTYIRFVPDYYLGVVYLNTNRDRDAEGAFARVNSQKLIGAKDPEYTAFERQTREATFNRAFGEALQLMAKGDFTQANSRLDQARATNVDATKVAALSSEIVQLTTPAQTAQVAPPVATPAQTPTQQAPPPTQQAPPPVQAQPTATVAASVPKAVPPGTTAPTRAAVKPAPPKPVLLNPGNAYLPTPGAIFSPAEALRNGLVAYFSGDYSNAIQLLEPVAQRQGAPPRARVFLACAKVGMVLTGGADAALLREARADFQGADPQRTLPEADRRFISPRVLEQLERP